MQCVFRDHALSDLIGFSYAGWPADAAADDFVARLAEAGRRFAAAGGRGEPVIFVILDGENAWEHFEGGGRPFLRALYGRLTAHPELRTVTMSEACRGAKTDLPGIFPGSWIDANFYIWIGHRDDQRAWSQLADARDALARPGSADASAVARAREEVLIAEGSDWFWWYGDDHSSEHDLEFDDLFRRHLRNVYGLLLKPVPDELFVSNISAGRDAANRVRADRTADAHAGRRGYELLRVARRRHARGPGDGGRHASDRTPDTRDHAGALWLRPRASVRVARGNRAGQGSARARS